MDAVAGSINARVQIAPRIDQKLVFSTPPAAVCMCANVRGDARLGADARGLTCMRKGDTRTSLVDHMHDEGSCVAGTRCFCS
jgi:hypothetical protein